MLCLISVQQKLKVGLKLQWNEGWWLVAQRVVSFNWGVNLSKIILYHESTSEKDFIQKMYIQFIGTSPVCFHHHGYSDFYPQKCQPQSTLIFWWTAWGLKERSLQSQDIWRIFLARENVMSTMAHRAIYFYACQMIAVFSSLKWLKLTILIFPLCKKKCCWTYSFNVDSTVYYQFNHGMKDQSTESTVWQKNSGKGFVKRVYQS